MKVDPGGKLYQKDPLLGYRHYTGKFRIVLHNEEVKDSLVFYATHDSSTLRITKPPEGMTDVSASRQQIWFFGDSNTYGFSVSDSDTYPWVVQEMLPEYDVVNWAVSGYSNLQSLLQMQTALKEGKRAKVAVLAYASVHDQRNAFLRQYRKYVNTDRLGELNVPFARVKNGKLVIGKRASVYEQWPLQSRLSIVAYLELLYCGFEDSYVKSNDITRVIMLKMSELCKENGVLFIVAGIFSDPKTRQTLIYCAEHGITTVDVSFDGEKGIQYSNLPFDGHPNALAHRIFAQKFADCLRAHLSEEDKTATFLGKVHR